MGGGPEGDGWKCEEVEKYKLIVADSHGGVKCILGNTGSDILITTCGVRWVQDSSR